MKKNKLQLYRKRHKRCLKLQSKHKIQIPRSPKNSRSNRISSEKENPSSNIQNYNEKKFKLNNSRLNERQVKEIK